MATEEPYGTLPKNTASSVKPFTLRIPDEDLKRMFDLLKLTPVAAPIFENSLPDGGRRLGLRRDWLVEAKRVWENEFDWYVHLFIDDLTAWLFARWLLQFCEADTALSEP